jgi:hypothetical protein
MRSTNPTESGIDLSRYANPVPARSPDLVGTLRLGVIRVIELSIDDAGLTRMERSLTIIAREQLPFAMSRALNDCAKAATVAVNRAMPEVFDRPTQFTERAAVAPRALAATKTRLLAELTLRPIQAQYLQLEETGGVRTGAMNTRKPSKTVLLPGKAMPLDEFGNIPRGTIAGFAAQVRPPSKRTRAKAAAKSAPAVFFLPAASPANLAKISGWFRRLPGHTLTRLTAFEKSTHYHERMGYRARVEAAVRATWPKAMLGRLHEAIKTAR